VVLVVHQGCPCGIDFCFKVDISEFGQNVDPKYHLECEMNIEIGD